MQKVFNADLLDIFPTDVGFIYACRESLGNTDTAGFFSYDSRADLFEKIKITEEDDEFIVLRVIPGKGEEVTLEPIEDDEEYDEVGHIFLERLAEMFSDEGEEE